MSCAGGYLVSENIAMALYRIENREYTQYVAIQIRHGTATLGHLLI